MTNPIVYNSYATALLNAEPALQLQLVEQMSVPPMGLEEGRTYDLTRVLSTFPSGPLGDAAVAFAEQPGASFSYRMVATPEGNVVPEYSFFRNAEITPVENFGICRTGGPRTPAPSGSSIALNIGGATVLIGGSLLLQEEGMPGPLVGPFMGTSFAFADTVFGNPALPTNQFFRTSLASMGVGTSVQTGWSYLFDATGVPMGTEANTWGSFGGTILTFTPAIESFAGVSNPLYSSTFRNALGSATGVGLTGAGSTWLTRNVFLARGGWAGGAGTAGAGMQALGAVGAVFMGSSLGGWITEEVTGMNDENDAYGQLARLARDRMYSDAWGALGRSPLGHLMGGLTCGLGYEEEFAEGMHVAEGDVARDRIPQIEEFSNGLNTSLAAILINSSPAELNQAMSMETLEQGIRTFYGQYGSRFGLTYLLLSVLDRNHDLPDTIKGMALLVGESGGIRDRKAFTTYAANLAESELRSRTTRLEDLYRTNGLTIRDGQIAPTLGTTFSEDQIAFIRGEGAQLTYEIIRLTNALATLRPTNTASN